MKELDSTASEQLDNEMSVFQEKINCNQKKEWLDESLSLVGISPHKIPRLAISTKVKSARVKSERSFQAQTEMAAIAYNIDKEALCWDKGRLQKANELERLHNLMKEKLEKMNLKTREKFQVLNIAPECWSRTKIAQFFDFSEYMVREAQKFCKEKGILAMPPPKKGNSLDEVIVKDVQLFFEDNEFSRLISGTKDYISIVRNIHKQKRPQCNLNVVHNIQR